MATEHDPLVELRSAQARRKAREQDANWLRHLGLHLLGEPEVELAKTHLAALAKVTTWRTEVVA